MLNKYKWLVPSGNLEWTEFDRRGRVVRVQHEDPYLTIYCYGFGRYLQAENFEAAERRLRRLLLVYGEVLAVSYCMGDLSNVLQTHKNLADSIIYKRLLEAVGPNFINNKNETMRLRAQNSQMRARIRQREVLNVHN